MCRTWSDGLVGGVGVGDGVAVGGTSVAVEVGDGMAVVGISVTVGVGDGGDGVVACGGGVGDATAVGATATCVEAGGAGDVAALQPTNASTLRLISAVRSRCFFRIMHYSSRISRMNEFHECF